MRTCLSILGVVFCLSASLAAQTGAPLTDDPLVPGVTPVRAVHLTELRTRINALRTANGLPTFTFTDPILTAGTTGVRGVHLVDLRMALSQVYTALGLTPPVFADPVIQPGATVVRAVHITELRTAVLALEERSE